MSKIEELIKEKCPNGVEFKNLCDVSEALKGMSGVSNKWSDEGNCRFIDYMNVYRNLSVDVTNTPYATVKDITKQNILIKNDILFTSASETIDECALSSVIENNIEDNIFLDDHLFGVRINKRYENNIYVGFLKHYLRSNEFREKVATTVRGVTRFYISKPDFMKLTIPIPPIEVQEEIAKILDKFSELEAQLEAQLEAELEARNNQYDFWLRKLINNDKIKKIKLYDLLDYIQPSKYIVNSTDYNVNYDIPVLTAGQTFILGYTNESSNIYNSSKNKPVIIFDDFTTSNHWVDFKFKVKSSAIKMLIPKSSNINLKYIYYCMQSNPYIPKDHSRQWIQTYSEFCIPYPSLEEQEFIVNILDKFNKLLNDISEGIPAEIQLRRKQYEYYRNKLLSFKRLKDF